MTQTALQVQANDHRASRLAAAGMVIALLSLLVVGALAVTDHASATDHGALSTLEFGRPMNWLVQDQTALDPDTYPREQSFISPWEHPVSVHVPAFLASFALVFGVQCLALVALSKARRRGTARAA